MYKLLSKPLREYHVECCHVLAVTFLSADVDGPIVVCGGVPFVGQTQIDNLFFLSFLLHKGAR